MRAPIRLFPSGDRDDDPEHLIEQIKRASNTYARLMGHASVCVLLAGIAQDHHLRSVPKPVRR